MDCPSNFSFRQIVAIGQTMRLDKDRNWTNIVGLMKWSDNLHFLFLVKTNVSTSQGRKNVGRINVGRTFLVVGQLELCFRSDKYCRVALKDRFLEHRVLKHRVLLYRPPKTSTEAGQKHQLSKTSTSTKY